MKVIDQINDKRQPSLEEKYSKPKTRVICVKINRFFLCVSYSNTDEVIWIGLIDNKFTQFCIFTKSTLMWNSLKRDR